MKILYFAWVRQEVGFGEEQLDLPVGVSTVSDLMEYLSGKSENYARAFAEPKKLRCAVNQTFMEFDAVISDGDEIAFFPPVTGG